MNKPALCVLVLLAAFAIYKKSSPVETFSDSYITKNKANGNISVQLITEGKDSTIAITNGNNIMFYTNKRGGLFHPSYRDNLVDKIVSLNITDSEGNGKYQIFDRDAELEPIFRDIDKDYRKYVNVVKAGMKNYVLAQADK